MAASTKHDARGEQVITRVFDAPIGLLFEVWTRPEHFVRWFRPQTVEMPFCELDARPGGLIHFCHAFDDGSKLWVKGSFLEVVPPERLVFTSRFVDAAGRPAAHPGIPDLPIEASIETTALFEQTDLGTRVSVYQRITPEALAAAEPVVRERRDARVGWSELFDRLSALLTRGEESKWPS